MRVYVILRHQQQLDNLTVHFLKRLDKNACASFNVLFSQEKSCSVLLHFFLCKNVFLNHIENCAIQSSLPERKAPLSSSSSRSIWLDNNTEDKGAFVHELCKNGEEKSIYINCHTKFSYRCASFKDPCGDQLYSFMAQLWFSTPVSVNYKNVIKASKHLSFVRYLSAAGFFFFFVVAIQPFN